MFEYLDEKDRTNLKKKISLWLKLFLIEPALKTHSIDIESYLAAYDRSKAAQMCYEYLLVANELKDTHLRIEKKKLVKEIAKYLDLRTPFIYFKLQGTPEYKVNKQQIEGFPFKYKLNNRNAASIINEAKRSLILNNKENWLGLTPSEKQMKVIIDGTKKKKIRLNVNLEEINKYQASVLIPFLLDKQNYDEAEIKLLVK